MDRHTDEISPLHAALEKSDWNLLNTTLITLEKAGNTSDTAAQLSVSKSSFLFHVRGFWSSDLVVPLVVIFRLEVLRLFQRE